MMKKLGFLIILLGKKLTYPLFIKPSRKAFLYKNVPYFSQWESRQLVGKFISGERKTENDPKWSNSGAKTKNEYALWAWNGCGMACLKMILSHALRKNISLVQLGKKCMEHGGYKKSREKNNLDGLFYKPFIEFIKKEFNLPGKIVSPMVVEEIIYELSLGKYVIASVTHEIRNPLTIPKQQGGHLVLVLGYNLDKQILYFHNPSGDTKESQEYATSSFSHFKKFFANRGIAISPFI